MLLELERGKQLGIRVEEDGCLSKFKGLERS